MARKKLGKGLSALVSETINEAAETNATMIAVSAIVPHKGQPRQHFDEEDLEELTNSIKQHGVLQPLLVRPKGTGYEIVAGERRYQASKRAGLKSVPALVQEVADDEIFSLALIENLQRADLNPLEEALSYKTLMDQQGLTQAQVAEIVSKSRSAIANALRLMDLPQEIQAFLEKGQLSSGHARALLMLESKREQNRIARLIIEEKLSVRDAEDLVRGEKGLAPDDESDVTPKAGSGSSRGRKTQEAKTAESALSDILDTRVSVMQKADKGPGSITIHFADSKELKRLLSKIG